MFGRQGSHIKNDRFSLKIAVPLPRVKRSSTCPSGLNITFPCLTTETIALTVSVAASFPACATVVPCGVAYFQPRFPHGMLVPACPTSAESIQLQQRICVLACFPSTIYSTVDENSDRRWSSLMGSQDDPGSLARCVSSCFSVFVVEQVAAIAHCQHSHLVQRVVGMV